MTGNIIPFPAPGAIIRDVRDVPSLAEDVHDCLVHVQQFKRRPDGKLDAVFTLELFGKTAEGVEIDCMGVLKVIGAESKIQSWSVFTRCEPVRTEVNARFYQILEMSSTYPSEEIDI